MRQQEEIVALLARRVGIPPDTIDTDDQLADVVPSSFTLVELLIELQETYGLRLSQEDLPLLRTVGDVVSLVANRRTR